MTALIQDFSPYITNFTDQFMAHVGLSAYRPFPVAVSISLSSSPFHEGGDGVLSMYTDCRVNCSSRGFTGTVIEAIQEVFDSGIEDVKTSWERGVSEHGLIKLIELNVEVKVISSAVPFTEKEFCEAIGVPSDFSSSVAGLKKIGELMETRTLTQPALMGIVSEFFPGVDSTASAIEQLLKKIHEHKEDSEPGSELLKILGISSIGAVDDDSDSFDKLTVDATGQRVCDVFKLALSHRV